MLLLLLKEFMQLWVIVWVFWRTVIPNGGKRGVGRKYGSVDNARIKLYTCFIVLQWQYSVNLTVTHAFEFLWTYTDISVFHISQRCRRVVVWMLMIHITIKKETSCCTCARLLLSLTFNSVARCTNHSLGWCWYTPVKAFYTVAVCVCVSCTFSFTLKEHLQSRGFCWRQRSHSEALRRSLSANTVDASREVRQPLCCSLIENCHIF